MHTIIIASVLSVLAVGASHADVSRLGVRVTTGFVERDLAGKFAAESAEALHFIRPLPVFEAGRITTLAAQLATLLTRQGQGQMVDAGHAWKHSVTALVQKINIVRESAVQPYRGRRGVAALGSVLNWCCDVAVDSQLVPLMANERRLADTVRSLVNAHAALEGDLGHTIGELRNFSSSLEGAFQRVDSAHAALQNNMTAFYRTWLSQSDVLVHMADLQATLSEALADEAAFATALGACAANRLSAQLVPVERLRSAVSSLVARLSSRRVRLAVDDVTALYTAPLAHCSVTQASLHVWVKVPLVTITEEWRVVEYVPLPFVWRNSTCTLFPGTMLALRSGDSVAVLRGDAARHCRSQSACQVPRVADHSAEGRCIRAAVRGGAVGDLADECAFTCEGRPYPAVAEVSVDRFVVANPTSQHIRVQCNGQSQVFPTNGLAAYHLTVPPHCTAEIGSDVLVHRRALAHDNASAVASGEILLPALWTTLIDDVIHPVDAVAAPQVHASVGSVLFPNWTSRSPRFMTPVHHAVIDVPDMEGVDLHSYRFFPGEEFVLLGVLGLLVILVVANLWWTSLLRDRRGIAAITTTASASGSPSPPTPPVAPAEVAAPPSAVRATTVKYRRSGTANSTSRQPLLRRATLSYPASTEVVAPRPALPLPLLPKNSLAPTLQ